MRRNLLPLGVLQTANIEFTSAAFLRLVERIIGTSHNQEALSPEGCLLFACRLGGPLMKQRDRCRHGWRDDYPSPGPGRSAANMRFFFLQRDLGQGHLYQGGLQDFQCKTTAFFRYKCLGFVPEGLVSRCFQEFMPIPGQ